MIHGLKNRLLIVPTLLLALQVCLADAPNGQLTIPFSKDIVPVWDLSGPYSFQHHAVGIGGLAVPVVFGLNVTQDTRGVLKGAGIGILQVNDQFVAARYTASGRVYRSGSDTRAVLSVNFTGTDLVAGKQRKVSAAVKYRGVIDPESLAIVGTARGAVSVSDVGSSRINEEIAIPLPTGANGSWSLNMNVITLNKISGTGVISISRYISGDTLPGDPVTRDLDANISGSYSSKRDVYSLRVSGIRTGRGNSLELLLAPIENSSQFVVVSLKGMLLGQRIRYVP